MIMALPAPPPLFLSTPPPNGDSNDIEIPETYDRPKRTRNTVIPVHLENSDIKKALTQAFISCRISVQWSLLPDPERHSDEGTIIAKTRAGFIIQYDDPAVGTQHIPPSNESVLIYKVEVLGKAALAKPIAASNRPPQPLATTIYADGGARPSNGGPGASGIVVSKLLQDNTITSASHSCFQSRTTNNISEAIAILAALKCAKSLIDSSTESFINIVVDSEIIYKATIGTINVKDQKLVPLITEIHNTFITIAGKVAICHMYRSNGNPADEVCTAAILTQVGTGDPTLFVPIPLPPPAAAKPKPTLTAHDPPTPTGEWTFPDLRKFKSRSRCPEMVLPQWTMLVAHALAKFQKALSNEQRESEIRNFFALPTLFLPQNVSVSRIVKKVSTNSPFSVQSSTGTNPRRPKTGDPLNRLAEAIHRLVADKKLRPANKLLAAASSSTELTFNEKVARLQEKFPQDEFHTSIPMENVPVITADEVVRALRAANRNAATAIDGWTSTLLLQAISLRFSIASQVGELLTYILSQPISTNLRDEVTLGRVVAIPKDATDVRPIVISSLFVNLMGSISVARDSKSPSPAQYAIGIQQGCQRIIHLLRHKLNSTKGTIVLKIDLRNAFGTVKRLHAESVIKNADVTLRQFFRVIYGTKSRLAAFGPDDFRYIDINNGIKQGDATSAYIFCHTIDSVIMKIASRANLPIQDMYAYMDDLTIITTPEKVNELINIVNSEFNAVGMEVNMQKSAVLSEAPIPSCPIKRVDKSQSFNLLGANISDNFNLHVKEKFDQTNKYFDLLQQVPLHPHILFVLLRICASPKITYYLSVTPPEHTIGLVEMFQQRLITITSRIVDPTGHTIIEPSVAMHANGCGFPDLKKHVNDIFCSTRVMAITGGDTARLALVNKDYISSHLAHQTDSQWLLFAPEKFRSLTPAQFATALSIRLNAVPPHLDINARCQCGTYLSQSNQYEHVLRCDESTSHTHASRHNRIRDAIAATCRAYGITVQVEPKLYSYADGRRHRPDIVFYTDATTLVTDITIVSPELHNNPGLAAQAADSVKNEEHCKATSKLGHRFIPAAMEAFGHIGKGFIHLVEQLSNSVLPSLKSIFVKDIIHTVTTVAAAARADAVHSAMLKRLWIV